MAREPPSARFEFPIMLYAMLEECTFDDELSKIVSWQPHGLSFKVHDREGFERILPRWFKEKYESFRCLLEQWGFIKLSRGNNRSCWYQVNFAHGRKVRLQYISKDDFLKGMPEYLSPREEPNLFAQQTPESSIATKEKRIGSSRDHTNTTTTTSGGAAANATTTATSSSDNRHHSATNSVASKSSSHKRSRDGDDSSSLASGSVTAPPPAKKEKKAIRRSSIGSTASNSNTNTTTKATTTVPPPATQLPPLPAASAPTPAPSAGGGGSGCKVCRKDDDHSNLLLCEGCDTESHTYCLDPPLDAVPDEDWFCDKCTRRMERDRLELTKLIKTIPEEMRSRFGEVCFSKSGERAMWWPAMIFDPRTFLQNKDVVELCKRNLGKRYLMFYFENPEAFAAVPKSWIMTWEEGVKKEFDSGKNVRNTSKARQEQHQQALEAARLAMLGSTDVESKHSDVTPEEVTETELEATPMSPLKEVDDDSVLCSKCGKVLEMTEGPVLADGYWQCHNCHKEAQALLAKKIAAAPKPKPAPPPPPPEPRLTTTYIQPVKDPLKYFSKANPMNSADERWLSVRNFAVTQVSEDDNYEIVIDDEVLKGITQRPSGKWQAQVYFAGKSRYIGVFDTREKAALAFKLVRHKLRPNSRAMPVYSKKKKPEAINGAVGSTSAIKPTPPSNRGASCATHNDIVKNIKASRPSGSKRMSSFTDKKPDHEKAHSNAPVPAVNIATPRYIDTERTKILLETPLCRFYSNIPLCDI